MANIEAAVNVVVKGQGELDRIIGKLSQLDGIIQNVKSTPLEINAGNSDRRILNLSTSVSGYENNLEGVRGKLKQIDAATDNYIAQIAKQQQAQRSLTAGSKEYSSIQKEIEKNQRALATNTASFAVNAENERKLLKKLGAARKELGRAEGAGRQIAFINELADSYVRLGDAKKVSQSGQFSSATGDKALAGNRVTNAQLRSQVALLQQVANNVELGSEKYREFTIAADVASKKFAASSRSAFNILAEAYSTEAPQTNFGKFLGAKDIAGARQQVDKLIGSFAQVAQSEAGLSAYRGELEAIKALVPIASREFIRLSSAIKEVDGILASVVNKDASKALGPKQFLDVRPSGPSSDILNSLKQRQKYAADTNKEFQRQSDLFDAINSSSIDSAQKDRLKLQVDQAINALAEDRLEVAREITAETQRQLRAEKQLARPQEQGPAIQLGSARGSREQLNYERDIKATREDLLRVDKEIDEILTAEEERSRLKKSVAEGLLAVDQGRLEVAQKIAKETRSDARISRRDFKDLQIQADRVIKFRNRLLEKNAAVAESEQRLQDISQGRSVDPAIQTAIDQANQLASANDEILRNKQAATKVDAEFLQLSKKQADSAAALSGQYRELEIIQKNWNKAKKQGVQFAEEETNRLETLLGQLSDPQFKTNPAVQAEIDKTIKDFKQIGRLRILETDPVSEQRQGPATTLGSPRAAADQIKYEQGGRSRLILEEKLLNKSLEAEAAYERLVEIQSGSPLYSNTDVDDFIAAQKNIGTEYAGQNKANEEAEKLFDKSSKKQADAVSALRGQYRELLIVQNNWNKLKEKGANFTDQEQESLQKIIEVTAKPDFKTNPESQGIIDEATRRFKQIARLRSSELPGGGSGDSAAKIEERRSRLLQNAFKLQGELQSLEGKGVSVANEKLALEQRILDIKNLQGKATKNELQILATGVQDVRTSLQEAKAGLQDISAASGFGKTLQDLKASLSQSSAYFGTQDPRQAIDEIYAQFAKPTGGAGGMGNPGQNVADTLSDQIRAGAAGAKAAGNQLGEAVEDGLNEGLGIASPALISIKSARNVLKTFTSEILAGAPAVKAALASVFTFDPASAAKSIKTFAVDLEIAIAENFNPKLTAERGLSGFRGETSDVAARLAGFAARMSSNPSGSRKLTSLMGDDITSSSAVTEALYRKKYEAGGITPATFLPASERRSLRGTAGIPGGGLEAALLAGATAAVSRTGAFVGPLSGPRVSMVGERSAPGLRAGLSAPPFLNAPALDAPALSSLRTDPWAGPVGDYRKFIAEVIAATERLDRLTPLLTSTKVAGALPPVSESIASAQQDRINAAYRRSAERELAVLSQDAFGDTGRPAISATDFGFMADPARIARLSGIGRALPPAVDARATTIDVTATAVDNVAATADSEGRNLTGAIRDLFERIQERIRGAISGVGGIFGGGGGGGGGPVPPGGGGGGLGGGLGGGDARNAVLRAQGGVQFPDITRLSLQALGDLSTALSAVRAQLDPTAAGFDRLERELRQNLGAISRRQQRLDPDADFLTRNIGPRSGQALSEGLIGGAFPLLFGQGVGAALGGGIGGAAGGFAGGSLGFGLSLIGTAAGTAIDTLIQKAQELGAALDDTTQIFDLVKERSLFAAKETEKLATRLQEAGLAAAASALAQEEVFKKIGPEGIAALSNVQTEADRANRAFAELGIQLQVLVAGPVAFFLEKISAAVNEETTSRKALQVEQRLRAAGKTEQADLISNAALQFDVSRSSSFKGLPGQPSVEDLQKKLKAEIEAGEFLVPVEFEAKIDPVEAKKDLISAFQSALDAASKGLEVSGIAKGISDQFRNAAREQEDLDRQRTDLLKSYEESIASIRLGVERKVQQDRLNNLRLENQVYEQQGEVRLQQLRNQNALISQSLNGNQVGQQLFDAVAQFTEQQLSTENEIANRRRSLEAEIQSINLEAQNYKIDVAKQVAELDKNTAKQIEDIRLNVLRKNQDFDKNRFEAEKRIALLRLNVERASAEKTIIETERLLPGVKNQEEKSALQQVITSLKALIAPSNPGSFPSLFGKIQATPGPQQLSFGSTSIGSNVSTAGSAALAQSSIDLKGQIDDLQNAITGLTSSGNLLALNKSFADIADGGAREAIAAFEDVSYEIGALLGIAGKAGKSPALQNLATGIQKAISSPGLQKSPLRDGLIELFKLYEELAKQSEKLTETTQFFSSALERNRDEISSLKEEINGAIAGASAYEQALASLAARGLSPASAQAVLLLESAKELDRLNDKAAVFTQISGAASEFSGSLRGLIEDFVELGSVSELATKFSEGLGKKALGFVLDIAFKPIEEQFEKQFFKIAEALGVDVKPEALKQLEETQVLTGLVGSIDQKIGVLIQSLSKTLLQQSFTPVEKTTASLIDQTFNKQSSELNSAIDQTRKFFAAGPSTEDAKNALSEFDEYVNKVLTPLEGKLPTANTRDYFNLGMQQFYENVKKARLELFGPNVSDFIPSPPVIPVPAQLAAPGGGPDLPSNLLDVGPSFGLADESKPIPVKVIGFGMEQLDSPEGAIPRTAAEQIGVNANGVVENGDKIGTAVKKLGDDVRAGGEGVAGGGNTLIQSLGKTVTGFAGAAAGVAAIAAGLQSVNQGGAYGVITGLATVFAGIASVTGSLSTITSAGAKTPAAAAPAAAANGAYFDSGIAAFANGGTFSDSIVNSPTLFQFADGGATRNGVMGEAGPEAIMPLKRGSDGRLGVSIYEGTRKAAGVGAGSAASSSRGDEERAREFAATAAAVKRQAMQQDGEAQQGAEVDMMRQMLVSSGPLNIRYESQVINNVEYVTRDQAERLASQSAQRGKELAIGTLQSSVRARKRVGIS